MSKKKLLPEKKQAPVAKKQAVVTVAKKKKKKKIEEECVISEIEQESLRKPQIAWFPKVKFLKEQILRSIEDHYVRMKKEGS